MRRSPILILLLAVVFAVITGYVNVHASEVQAPLACLLMFSGILGLLAPEAAWRWGLIIGLSIPASTFFALAINFKMDDVPRFPITLAVLVIPATVAAYLGVLAHRVLGEIRHPQAG